VDYVFYSSLIGDFLNFRLGALIGKNLKLPCPDGKPFL